MQLEFETMNELLDPEGCQEWSRDLFKVSEEYDERLMQVGNLFAKLVNERRSGDPGHHGLCHSTLVREYTRLLDEHAPPSCINELVYASYIMGRAIGHTLLLTSATRVSYVPTNPSFGFGNNQATA